MMRQDGCGNEQLKWYQWKFYLIKMDWQSILNWSCCPNTNREEPPVSVICFFYELRYINCNVYAYFSSVKLDKHIISSNSACMWSSSKVLRDAIQACSIGRSPKYHILMPKKSNGKHVTDRLSSSPTYTCYWLRLWGFMNNIHTVQ